MNIPKKIATNISDNYQFYCVRLFLDTLLEHHVIQKRYMPNKHSGLMYAIIIHHTILELLKSRDIAPRSYRRILSRIATENNNPDQILDMTKTSCEQFHVDCDDKFISCTKHNFNNMFMNMKYSTRLYLQLYGLQFTIQVLMRLYKGKLDRESVLKMGKKLLEAVVRSAYCVTVHGFIFNQYLTIVEKIFGVKTQDIHYGFGHFLGAVITYRIEQRSKVRTLNQFLLSIYFNMIVCYTLKSHKHSAWKGLFGSLLLLSIYKRGPLTLFSLM